MGVEQRTSHRGSSADFDASAAIADDLRGRELARRLLALVDERSDSSSAETGSRPRLEGAEP